MNDTSGKTSSSSLAITEKRTHRSGGCVGIFFQLFDWNRRLAKKKLFSRKLLPPARAKRVSKKFGGDEKLPMAKLLLIADENRGGFPNTKKSEIDNVNSSAQRAHEMRAPSLVARLMGLESMPAVRRDKPKKASFSEFNNGQEKKSASSHSVGTSEIFGCDQEDFHLEKRHTKLESRPQKLQKTGLFDRRPVTRFGADALQFKNVMSLSRKHHPKLTSPVKSPRVGRNAARLMEAATKILEPGLQATNRAKCALTYRPSLHLPPKDEFMNEGTTVITPDLSKQSSYCMSGGKSLKGTSSCKSCGNWLDVVDSRSTVEEQVLGFASYASGLVSGPSQGSGQSELKPPISSFDQERDDGVKNQELSLDSEAKANTRMRSKNFTYRNPNTQFREAQDQHHMSSQRIKSQKDVASAGAFKQRIQKQSQMSLTKDRVISRPKSSNLRSKRDSFTVGNVIGAKDFVTLNRNSTCHTRTRMPSKVSDNCKIDIERNAWNKRDDSSSRLRDSIRKRRSINGNVQVENVGFIQSTVGKQRNVGGDVIIGKVVGHNSCSVNQNHAKSDRSSEAKGAAVGGRKDADVVSFMFSSPVRHKIESSLPKETMEKTKALGGLMSDSISQQKKFTLDANSGNPSSRMETKLKGDALGVLLEEKLRELTCRDRDESEIGDALVGRSTASILEELISALTAIKPSSLEDEDNSSVRFNEEDSLLDGQMFNMSTKFRAEAKAARGLYGRPLVCDGDQPSPGSVLDASFSNDSCFSESLDGSSGHRLLGERSYDQLKQSELDADISDSATSLNSGTVRCDQKANSLNIFSSILCGVDPVDVGLLGNKLNHAREVMIDAGIMFGNTGLCDANCVENFPIGILLDKLEILSNAPWKCGMSFMEAKNGLQLRRFLFDCVIECLDSKFGHYCKSRYTTWPKMLLNDNGVEFMTSEVYGEIRRWTNLAGKTPDEMIEREMSHSFGKWTDFEIEAFETGSEIERDILRVLVDEMVIELWQCKTGSS